MSTPATKPLPSLMPTLPDAVDRRISHPVTDLQGGDQLHLKAKLLGFPKGAVLPIYGYCALFDADGRPYSVRAYVRGGQQAVAYSEREAVRFRFESQTERWFGAVLMYLTEIDLTDFADILKLERQPDELAQLLRHDVSMRLAA